MISGFGASYATAHAHAHSSLEGNFPIPFNLPNVLSTLLFSDLDLNLDTKQKDILENLRFSHQARSKMLEKISIKEQELMQLMLTNDPDGKARKEHEDLQFDKFQGSETFIDLVNVMADLLTREQNEKLLNAVGIKL